MPAAIDLAAWTAIAPAADRRVEVVSLNLNKSFAFSLDDAARPTRSWSDYVQGVAVMLQKAGFCLAGANLMIPS